MRQVAMSTRPLATVEAICKDYPSVQHQVDIDERPDASDVQPLRVRVQRRQGLIYREQEPRFRALERLALRRKLTVTVLAEADRVSRLFRQPGPINREWAKAELLAVWY
jgi:hypothetical protein